MTTISAKELRQNLSEYLHRAMHGEEIEVIYRSRPAVRLQPALATTGPAKGSAAAFLTTMAALEPQLAAHRPNLDPNKSIKELYHELLDSDPKYQGQR